MSNRWIIFKGVNYFGILCAAILLTNFWTNIRSLKYVEIPFTLLLNASCLIICINSIFNLYLLDRYNSNSTYSVRIGILSLIFYVLSLAVVALHVVGMVAITQIITDEKSRMFYTDWRIVLNLVTIFSSTVVGLYLIILRPKLIKAIKLRRHTLVNEFLETRD